MRQTPQKRRRGPFQEWGGRILIFSTNLNDRRAEFFPGVIKEEDYLPRRRALIGERRTIEEQIVRLERAPAAWVEPVRNWIQDASRLGEIAESKDIPSKKSPLQKVFEGMSLDSAI